MNKLISKAILSREVDKEFVAKYFGGAGSGRYPAGSGGQNEEKSGAEKLRDSHIEEIKRRGYTHDKKMSAIGSDGKSNHITSLTHQGDSLQSSRDRVTGLIRHHWSA